MAKYELENVELRKAYSTTLVEMINEDKRVFVLESDLAEAISTNSIAKSNKENYINCGIMEANMVGVASGLSLVGDIPFIHTFSPFATRRMFDQVFLSGAYAKTNIKILGSDPGIYTQHNGGTHTSFEDIALMRTIPTATVMSITDTTMMKNILRQIKDIYGIHYLSAVRKGSYKIYNDDETFEIGKGKVLREGKDVTIVACGIMVVEALKAADMLLEEGIEATVIDMFTIKPIDKDLIIKYSKQTKGFVTAENHNIIGGLGSAVAEVLVENNPVPMRRVGVEDRFGQVGTLDYLREEYKLTAEEIVKKAKELL
ncbi:MULTISPECIES: transketolase family protein [Fusobacterium]|uniref:transketolase family protein n=1 Tax=Fusobacterium TaxID=848 RepID=UPI001476A45A|nr:MULTISPECIES: transketolase C-terminal domain-containing protein [Fusobacterium]NME35330.1 transketolase family protein [Fusobacterium sp. FSA-380-WT-3A]